ncbi:MAG: MarR family transcriptional regulator [Fibrobacter sp.]|nr:MarR family transcriptional regulator [Fibrobacter sp.]
MRKKTQQTIPQPANNSSEAFRSLIEIVWHFGPKSLDGTCCEKLSMPEFIALQKISTTQNCPVQEIGIRLGFTKSGATRIVNRLEKKGFAKKHKFQNDARVCCVTITSKGQQALESADTICISRLEQMLSNVPVNSQKSIKDALVAMANALNK